MNRIYFDNAATTALDPQVLEAMMPYLTDKFGNPSSIYSYGRETRMAIEAARKSVAKILNAHPAEIFFTSGGTESSNTAITASVRDLGCRHIITSPIEHHAVSHSVEYLDNMDVAKVSLVKLLPNGHIDLDDLERLLAASEEKTLVTLMHANNEIGNILDIHAVGRLCKLYNAIFHSDTVQTVGHFPFDLRNTPVHFITGAAHKFHGPKGVGILYINENVKIKPFVHGGAQERNMRAGTENLYGIVGFAKALELHNGKQIFGRRSFFDKIGVAGCLLAAVLLLAPLVAAYIWLLPFLADKASGKISPELEKQVGDSWYQSLTATYTIDQTRSELVQQFYDSLHFGGQYPMKITVVREPVINAF
ncbi:MAG TPA: cysteine desulfurase family protein, partial [Ferruginibacter sp.]|nr:cysteine desulfurase family protein [Ferruginibacter sp.]